MWVRLHIVHYSSQYRLSTWCCNNRRNSWCIVFFLVVYLSILAGRFTHTTFSKQQVGKQKIRFLSSMHYVVVRPSPGGGACKICLVNILLMYVTLLGCCRQCCTEDSSFVYLTHLTYLLVQHQFGGDSTLSGK